MAAIAAFAALMGILVAIILVVTLGDGDDDEDPAVEDVSPSPTATPTETPTPTPTEATPSPTPPATATPTETPTEEPTATATPDDDDEPTPDDDEGPGDVGQAEIIRRDTEVGDELVAYLTFDAGSDRGSAAEILDMLAAEDITASFGITGQWAENNPDLVARLVDEGHELFNHTYSHDSFTGFSTGNPPLTEAERIEEITRTDEIFEEIAGIDGRPFWRPPYGDLDDPLPGQVGGLGYEYILMWTIDTLGWQEEATEQSVIDRVLDQIEPGAIVLMHVGAEAQDFAALDDIIDALRADGYSFASVAEMDRD